MKNKTITVNRKAFHDYIIEDTFEAGLVLTGTEIKSIRMGNVNIRDAYARMENGEMWLLNAHISRYTAGNRSNHDPVRPRKLLMHKREIRGFGLEVARKGFTLVPIKIYLKDGRAKVEIGMAKGKKLHDKRRSIADRDSQRELARVSKWQKS